MASYETLPLLRDPSGILVIPDDTDGEIIGVSTVEESSIPRVRGIATRQSLSGFVQFPDLPFYLLDLWCVAFTLLLCPFDYPSESVYVVGVPVVLLGWLSLLSRMKGRLYFRHVHIQFMEVYVGEYRGDDAALRWTTIRFVVGPVLYVARFEHGVDEIDESFGHLSNSS